jgi:fructokinase
MRIGIDLGGTKIEALALDRAGRELSRARSATPRGDYPATIAQVVRLTAEVEQAAGRADRIGIGIPGAISARTGAVKNANATWLNGRPLDRDLAAALARPVRVANDANCFAVSEATDGAGAGRAVVFGVILGTGVGGGIAIDGRAWAGANGIAGEWGHNPLPWARSCERPGPACYCGRRGCIETFVSGPGMAERFCEATGRRLSAERIFAAADAGDDGAGKAVERYLSRLARALAGVVNVLDPEVVVLGGGLSNAAALYEGLPERIARWAFSDRLDTLIARNRHGDASGVRGAAWLWPPGSEAEAG